MKRGNVRTRKKYITNKDGEKVTQYIVEGRIPQKGGRWQLIGEKKTPRSKTSTPLIFDNEKEAEEKLLEIAKQIKRRR